jgi:adenosine 3'-phospho 5'-phosphosulfate transporter B3
VVWGVCGGGLRNRKAPHLQHAIIGCLSFATMFLSNQSLLTLNYPTQTLFKSAKLIPVMIGALVINKKKFHILEYAGAACLLAGLVAFTLTDINVTPKSVQTGVRARMHANHASEVRMNV